MNKILNTVKMLTLLLLIFLSACSSNKSTGEVSTAAIPLNDLNLVKGKIPELLIQSKKNPYSIPSDQSCKSLDVIITALNGVLKADYDDEDNSKKSEKSSTKVINKAVKSLVPFRGWIRKLSGAERYSKKVISAIAAGIARRAFIKGIRSTKQCPLVKQLSDNSEVK